MLPGSREEVVVRAGVRACHQWPWPRRGRGGVAWPCAGALSAGALSRDPAPTSSPCRACCAGSGPSARSVLSRPHPCASTMDVAGLEPPTLGGAGAGTGEAGGAGEGEGVRRRESGEAAAWLRRPVDGRRGHRRSGG